MHLHARQLRSSLSRFNGRLRRTTVEIPLTTTRCTGTKALEAHLSSLWARPQAKLSSRSQSRLPEQHTGSKSPLGTTSEKDLNRPK